MSAHQSSGHEVVLSNGHYTAVVSSMGASLRQFQSQRPLLWGYSGTSNKKGGQGDVLIPFPGRIAGGTYEFDGKTYQLEKNDKEGPNAIHGFVRTREWQVEAKGSTTGGAGVTFSTKVSAEEFRDKGYPFSIAIEVSYAVSDSGLRCDFKITNVGAASAPVGAGFHPYFVTGSDFDLPEAELEIPASSLIEFNDRLLPTGRIIACAEARVDFRTARPVAEAKLNHCFTDFSRDREGLAMTTLKNPRTGEGVLVWMDKSFDYLVAYTGDALGPNARKAIALEPMTCATDAFNRKDWGLRILAPLETFSGSWGARELARD